MIHADRIRIRINDFITFIEEKNLDHWWLEDYLENRLDEYIDSLQSSEQSVIKEGDN